MAAKKWRKSGSLKAKANQVAAAGRTGPDGVKDTEIIHVNKAELPIVDRALRRYGGSGGRNPNTGKKEYLAGAGKVGGFMGGVGAGAGRVGAEAGRIGGDVGKGTASGSNTAKPPQSASPTPADDTLGASPESAAAALGSGGAQPLGDASNAPQKNLPTGVTGMGGGKKPRGATPFIGDPSAGQVLGAALGAAASAAVPGAGALNAAGDLETDKDGNIKSDFGAPTKGGFIGKAIDSLTGGTPGPQTGWSAERDHGVPGDVGGSGGAQGTPKGALPSDEAAPKPKPAKGDTAAPAPSGGAAAAAGGGTITVNPDGTVRTQDTSVAGLRAKRRYGATMKPKAA